MLRSEDGCLCTEMAHLYTVWSWKPGKWEVTKSTSLSADLSALLIRVLACPEK
jgi:hypothetical protein